MTVVYVGIGSNIDKHKHVEEGVKSLSLLGQLTAMSTIYESPAVGFEGKTFFNLIVEMTTSLKLYEFSNQLKEIEIEWGRDPGAQKFQDRTLDMDILLFGQSINKGKPQVPREDIYKYPFVIQPLFELNPELIVPDDGRTVCQIWSQAKDLDVLRVVKPWFNPTITE
ncbi:2-amino-4-hydroxy-6-hydroxymethyldihydropteridine diphosphokinase [Vibrio salinus]|uniref:2-amino-4-hydroxy-6- hydroxymethyldihydropteridine diphosphokinase n=1 Tax=Vibrio salinus TaxID=2899784 RepID=UPI001E6359E6|nr:2-amino-4-hydroxy-6-hydroxymethyldihydropteridine diphosphokinase [Vibrio salinus]MCE0494196.1 2-amino-4-hydroxy-6-hydroxymethyldihydropteridine diphosphokinase [Vibrio salinus]